jgi:hypothetical protein
MFFQGLTGVKSMEDDISMYGQTRYKHNEELTALIKAKRKVPRVGVDPSWFLKSLGHEGPYMI